MTASSGAAPPAAMPRLPAAPRQLTKLRRVCPRAVPARIAHRVRDSSTRNTLIRLQEFSAAVRERRTHRARARGSQIQGPRRTLGVRLQKNHPVAASCTARPSKLKRTLAADMSAARSAVAVVEIVYPKSNPRGVPPLARSSTLLPCCAFDMNYTEPDQASEPTNKLTRVDGTEDPAQTLHLSLVRSANSGRAGTKHCQSYSGPGLKQKSDARRLDPILLHITRGLTSRQRPLSGLVIVLSCRRSTTTGLYTYHRRVRRCCIPSS